ncbi:SDR family NAD(P)-dependent oxidoreductase [Actinoallomurus rhizosphaericola]|uniref:SDR family NAD(P)-dependent oxidoreductase n=1 Tax=Actinoallomurus rhizosphaericola TaxID=2952536 RepID=UPI002093FC1E|nr:SDR family NAD(P)-dependent oxidoreductase [Actinoallomurus rhizosphaericola]MCO5996410.1 SDR family NAD(P)-dependent oxidoreductase [Actinoallomurus rhizosphaericola]
MTTVLITGSTAGVGRYLAGRLAERGMTVLLHGRDQGKLDKLAAETGGRPYLADLSSLAEVRDLAARVRADLAAEEAGHPEGARLDVLINNAGVGSAGGRRITTDGHELHWAVNYLAPVLLTRLLLPALGPGSRIVNEGSLGQDVIDFDDLTMERRYTGTLAYCRSKLALAAWSFDLAAELDGIAVNCVHPATYMDTAMVREAGITPWSTVEEGGDAVLRLVTDETGTGLFFDGMTRSTAHRDAYDPSVRRRLREVTDHALAAVDRP